MRLIRYIVILAFGIAVLIIPTTVFAAPINNVEIYDPAKASDEIVFIAGEHQGSQTGDGIVDTQNESEQSVSSQNAALVKEQRALVEKMIINNTEKSMGVYLPGTSVIIREDIPLSWSDIAAYINNGLKFKNIHGLQDISYRDPAVEVSENTMQAVESLKTELIDDGVSTGMLPFSVDGNLLTWEWLSAIDTSSWTEDMIQAWKEILNTFSWTQIRTDLIGGGIIDWPYQELRYEVLKAYAGSLSMSDLVETTNITEYRVSKEEKQKIISKQPVSEYKWEIYDAEGNILKATHTYGRTLRLSFSNTGTYYIKAYQKHYVTRADVVSTQKSQYWFISETKQILWSSQLKGREFTYNRNVAEEFIETNYIQQDITASMLVDNWIFNLDHSGNLQIVEGFQVERVK